MRENRPEYVLESFFYIKPWQVEEMPKWKMFLLDSGAFTFMHGVEASSKPVDWDGYMSRYIDFINRHNVQHFFELDVDIIVGYDAVKRMRTRLEAETGKQSILNLWNIVLQPGYPSGVTLPALATMIRPLHRTLMEISKSWSHATVKTCTLRQMISLRYIKPCVQRIRSTAA